MGADSRAATSVAPGTARRAAAGAPLVTPKGMGDLLPPEAAARRDLSMRVLRSFELAGYELVTPPVFEHAEVLERGNGALENRDLLRFVEPESGEVAVLRPDITPQIARIVATRLADRPPPFRLCYEGRVFRRQRGRARNHRQISQAGVECVGLPGADGDTEVLALAIGACKDAGLEQFRVELSDIRLVRSLLEEIPAAARAAASEAIAQKDAAALRGLVADRKLGEALEALLDHFGDGGVLDSARKRFTSAPARAAIRSLQQIVDRLAERGLTRQLCFDLSETRGLSYYTGVHFSIFAQGPGEALGGGGRYDTLLSRFGFDAPATGFALDLGHLQWTLRAQGRGGEASAGLRVVVAGNADHASVARTLERLRRAGIVAAALTERSTRRCLAFARAWEYDAVLVMTRGAIRLLRVADESSHALLEVNPDLVRRILRGPARRPVGPMEG
jgi:ATP phosphoribosyltransferase regulatory subunit